MIKISATKFKYQSRVFIATGFDHAGDPFELQISEKDFSHYCLKNDLEYSSDSFMLKCNMTQFILAASLLPRLDLKAVNRNTIIGAAIVAYYEEDPEGTMKSIREMHEDNPGLMSKVIGPENVKKII